MRSPPVPANRSSTSKASSRPSVDPKVLPPSASGCTEMPVSARRVRTGTVMGPESVFDSTVSTRRAGACGAMESVAPASAARANASSTTAAPAPIAACAR
jgi:hypothetical protein